MTVTELSTEWYVAESMDEYSSVDKYARPVTFVSGQKGYVKRSIHDSDYLAVLMRNTLGNIYGWWIRADLCEELLVVLKPAPTTSDPESRWSQFWQFRFRD